MDFEFDDKTKKLFAEEKMGKLLFSMSLPVIIAIIISAIYNIVDTIFIGRSVGQLGVAGIGVGFPVQLMVNSLGILIGLGGSSVISRALGSNDNRKAKQTIGTTYLVVIFIYIVIVISTLPFLDNLIKGLGANSEVAPFAFEYLKYIIPGSLFILLAVGAGNLLMAQGKPELAMMQLVVGAILNLILDPIFIFVFNMGVSGAAIATVISQGLSLLMVIYFQFSKMTSIMPKLSDFIKIKLKIAWEIISLGTPAFLQEIGASILIILVNNVLNKIGGSTTSSLLASFGILNKLPIFLITPLIGIAQGFMPIAGYNYGAGNFARIKEAFKLSTISAFLVTLVLVALVVIFPVSVLSVFTNDSGLVQTGVTPLRLIYLALPFATFSVVTSMYFMGVGKIMPAVIISLSRQTIILIPLIIILSSIFGLNGLWISFPISDILAVIIAYIWIKYELREMT